MVQAVKGLAELIASSLNERKMYTVINGNNSDTMPTCVSIPQGSVLGPTLFSLFTYDLLSCVESRSLFLFADDITIYCIKRMAEKSSLSVGKSLDELNDWRILNRLNPHPEKS